MNRAAQSLRELNEAAAAFDQGRPLAGVRHMLRSVSALWLARRAVASLEKMPWPRSLRPDPLAPVIRQRTGYDVDSGTVIIHVYGPSDDQDAVVDVETNSPGGDA